MTVPEGWTTKPLDQVAYVQTGLAKKDGANLDGPELPYLRVANVQDGYLDLAEIKTIRVPVGREDRYLLQDGDVLFTEGGDFDKLGRGCVWRSQIARCVHQNHVFAVRADRTRLMPEFLAAQAMGDHGKAYFLTCAKQTTNLASINATQLRAFPTLLPPLAEQRKIAEILGTWDEAIALVERRLAAARARKQGLMQRLLTGQVRFPGFTEPWREVRLGEVAGVSRVLCDPSDMAGAVVEHYSMPAVSATGGPVTEPASSIRSMKFAVPIPSVLVSRLNPDPPLVVDVGSGSALPKLASTEFVVLQPRITLTRRLLYHVILTPQFAAAMRAYAGGTSSSHQRIQIDDLLSISIGLPGLSEQQQIVRVLDNSERLVSLESAKVAALQAQKRGLMQRLLTGEVRVRV
ncbi:MAG: restriction endonuclease subunit S [Anaerolineae bacterium]